MVASATGRGPAGVPAQEENVLEQLMTTAPEQIPALDTGYGPESESALLRDVLTQTNCAGPNALAVVQAYKHRLQAIRCEYVHVHVRAIELQEQLAEARLQIA